MWRVIGENSGNKTCQTKTGDWQALSYGLMADETWRVRLLTQTAGSEGTRQRAGENWDHHNSTKPSRSCALSACVLCAPCRCRQPHPARLPSPKPTNPPLPASACSHERTRRLLRHRQEGEGYARLLHLPWRPYLCSWFVRFAALHPTSISWPV
jgi:hypothetical protein